MNLRDIKIILSLQEGTKQSTGSYKMNLLEKFLKSLKQLILNNSDFIVPILIPKVRDVDEEFPLF